MQCNATVQWGAHSPQQCDNGGGEDSPRRGKYSNSTEWIRAVEEGSVVQQPGPFAVRHGFSHCTAPSRWFLSGYRWFEHRTLRDSIPSGWRKRVFSHTIGTTTEKSCLWSLPGRRRPTSELKALQHWAVLHWYWTMWLIDDQQFISDFEILPTFQMDNSIDDVDLTGRTISEWIYM